MTEPTLPVGLVRPALAAVDPYVPGRPVSDVARATGVADIVKLASNEGPLPPSDAAQEAIAAALADLRVYPDPGAWDLRSALETHLGVPAERIMVGNGVDSLIKLVCTATLDPGDSLVMGWPSFPSWRQGALTMGATPILVPLAEDGAYDLTRLREAITDTTKLVVIVSPNNPTGGAVSAGDLAAFLADLPDHVLPVIDEAYFEFMDEDRHDAVALTQGDRPLAVTRTFSKIYGLAGLRVGYLVAPPELIGAIGRIRNVFDVNHMALLAATASVRESDAIVTERAEANRRERERVAAELTRRGYAPLPSQGNFVFFDLGTAERAGKLNDDLTARGMIIRPTAGFGAPSGIRVTIGTPEQNDRFLALLDEVGPLASESAPV